MSLYARKDEPGTFAHNRMQLLLGSHLVSASGGKIVLTSTGLIVAWLVKSLRSFFGIGNQPSKGQKP